MPKAVIMLGGEQIANIEVFDDGDVAGTCLDGLVNNRTAESNEQQSNQKAVQEEQHRGSPCALTGRHSGGLWRFHGLALQVPILTADPANMAKISVVRQ